MGLFPKQNFIYGCFEVEILMPKVKISTHAFKIKTVLPRASLIRSFFMTNLNFFTMASIMRLITLLFKEESNVKMIPSNQTSPLSDITFGKQ